MKRTAANEAEQDALAEAAKQQTKMTRPVNGVGASVGAAAPKAELGGQNPVQILRLLQDLGERLRRSEAERETLWRELDRTQKLLVDIQDHSGKAEKAFISLENQIARREKLTQDLIDRQAEIEQIQKDQTEAHAKVASRLDTLETTAGSAIVRIEDALTEASKLSRRLEQISQDKARLLRKIETMEETLTTTQDTLKAKALVLLTDQTIAARTALPQSPALTDAESTRIQARMSQAAEKAASFPAAPDAPTPLPTALTQGQIDARGGVAAWWSRQTWRASALTGVPLVILALAAGWGFSRMNMPSVAPVSVPVPSTTATDISDVDAVVKQAAVDPSVLNNIEPGALDDEGADAPTSAADPVTSEDYARARADEKKALDEFMAEAGSLDAIVGEIKPDAKLPKVAQDIEKKAFEGNAESQHDLAAIYTAGHAGVKTNYARAAQWFRAAAVQGVANAQYNLGVLYHQGLGVKQDTEKAIRLYRVAANQQHPEAQYNLGIAHMEGVGADYNPHRAAAYFEDAAKGGIVEAAYNFGLIQENGLLGESRPEDALFWYKTAADRNNAQAREAYKQLVKQMDITDDAAQAIVDKISPLYPDVLRAPVKKEPALPVDLSPRQEKQAVEKPAKKEAAAAAPVKPASAYDPVIVSQIQEQLMQLGLYPGPADGENNPLTQDAVRSYQSVNNMAVDGRPTEDVLVHMLAQEMQINTPARSGPSDAEQDDGRTLSHSLNN